MTGEKGAGELVKDTRDCAKEFQLDLESSLGPLSGISQKCYLMSFAFWKEHYDSNEDGLMEGWLDYGKCRFPTLYS